MPKKEFTSSGDGRVIPRLPKEDGESKADYLKRVKNSGRGYKARFSIAAKSAKRLAQAVEKVPTPAGVSQINAMIQEIRSTLAPIKDRAQEMLERTEDEEERETAISTIEDYTDEADTLIANLMQIAADAKVPSCLLYTSPSPRDKRQSRMPSSA